MWRHMEVRGLKFEEMDAWFDHCMYAFNEGEYNYEYRQEFANHWRNDPWRDLDGILVAVEDNEILSTVRVFQRNVYLLGEEISLGGIGEVCTKPAHRGKGLSTILLGSAIELMEKRNIRISLLLTGIYSFYARLGWIKSIMFRKSVGITGKGALIPNIRPLDIEKDCGQLMRIYGEYCTKLNGPVVRNNEFYWKNWVMGLNMRGLIWEDGTNNPVAYIFGAEEEGVLNIREFGAAGGYEDVFSGMVSHLCALAGREGCEVNFPAAVKSSFPDEKLIESGPYMLRLITPFKVNGAFIDSTEDLLRVMYGRNGCCHDSDFVFWGADGF